MESNAASFHANSSGLPLQLPATDACSRCIHHAVLCCCNNKPMPRKAAADDASGCRFGWYPRILTFLVSAGLGLSLYSSLDCKFLEVKLDFIPKNYQSDSIGISLWSYVAPDGYCLSYSESRNSTIFNFYANYFITSDTSLTTSKILAMVGVVFGSFALISCWVNIFTNEPYLVDVVTYTIITAFLCECSKIGLFWGIDVCNTSSGGCSLDMGAYVSIISIGAYMISMTLAVGYATRPKNDAGEFETASLPSWASEPSTQKAQAPPRRVTNPMSLDQRSSIDGYAWSHSAQSTIPSTDMTPQQNNYRATATTTELALQNVNPFDDVKNPFHDESPLEQSRRSSMRSSGKSSEKERLSLSMRSSGNSYRPPPSNKVKYDDTSTLTWDPGY